MIVPAFLFLVSMAAVAAAMVLPALRDLLLVAGPSALASLWLVLRALSGMRLPRFRLPRFRLPGFRLPRRARRMPPRPLVVDGSNVMFWNDNTPLLATVKQVLDALRARGFAPGVMFDANAGYLIDERYIDDRDFARLLGLPADRVVVAPKGTPADEIILVAARDLGARIVSNDRFRDWAGDHPEVAEAGHLIKGGYRDGALWLDLEEGAPRPPDNLTP